MIDVWIYVEQESNIVSKEIKNIKEVIIQKMKEDDLEIHSIIEAEDEDNS